MSTLFTLHIFLYKCKCRLVMRRKFHQTNCVLISFHVKYPTATLIAVVNPKTCVILINIPYEKHLATTFGEPNEPHMTRTLNQLQFAFKWTTSCAYAKRPLFNRCSNKQSDKLIITRIIHPRAWQTQKAAAQIK